jgi:hypothetical protein
MSSVYHFHFSDSQPDAWKVLFLEIKTVLQEFRGLTPNDA